MDKPSTFILQNEAQCVKCKDVIWSASRHDFKSCSCRAISVDGGQEYIRRVAKTPADYIERSLTVSDKTEFLKLCKVVGFMREANLSKECLALLVIFGYHRDHENFDKEKHKVLVYDCIDEIERTARTGRNALGLVLGVIRKIREHRCLDANMFEEPEETVNPCNEN